MPKASALPGLMHEWERICRLYLARVDELETDRELMADHLYHHFLCTHPFADGNGRTGRLMRSAMRVMLGLSWGTITTYNHSTHVRKLIEFEDNVFRPSFAQLY
jgi:fido (protein-threonine AMPylation protein)